MYEYDCLVFTEDNIGISRQAFRMKTETIPRPVKKAADEPLCACISGLDATHYLTSFLGGEGVHGRSGSY